MISRALRPGATLRHLALVRMAAGVVSETPNPKALLSFRKLLSELLPWRSEP